MKRASDYPRTWFLDLDGVVFKHNRYKAHPRKLERAIPEAIEFLNCIPRYDKIVLTTGRPEKFRKITLKSLQYNRVKFTALIMGLPRGARIVLNDEKPTHTKTAFGFTVARNANPTSPFPTVSQRFYLKVFRELQK